MSVGSRLAALVITACLAVPAMSAAQTPDAARPDVWRDFASRIDIGSELIVRLDNGQRFRAALVAVRDDAVLVQPKTRVAVPVQPVPYDAILSLERPSEGGMGAGKAAAIGVASGAGTFLAILLILLTAWD